MANKIYIKYFNNLEEGYPGILISGEYKCLELLKDLLMQLFYKNMSIVNISNLPFVKPINNIQLIAFSDNNNIGLEKVDENKYLWKLTSSKWFEYAEIISGLKKYPSHQYFDIDSDDLLIIISNGEYKESWTGWEK